MDTTGQLREALEELLERCLITFTEIEVEKTPDNVLRFNIKTIEPAIVIGKHAEHLFALQQVFRILSRKKFGMEEHVIIDVDNYRRSQEESAARFAEEAALRAKESGLPQELMPMPSYKRRAVHTFFTRPENQDFRVYSVGEGEQRRVRVEPKNTMNTM